MAGVGCVVCCPRLWRRAPRQPFPEGPQRLGIGILAVLLAAGIAVLRRRRAPGRERAIGRLPGPDRQRRLPEQAAARPEHRPDPLGGEHGRQDDPRPRDHDLHHLECEPSGRDYHDRDDRPPTGTSTTKPAQVQGSFSVRSDQPGLAIPFRPVWILEDGYPKLAGETASAGAEAAQTDTFASARSRPTRPEMVWNVTPVQPGTYTVHYRVAAGLRARRRRSPTMARSRGRVVVRISNVPPQTRVNDAGQVVPIKPATSSGRPVTLEEVQARVSGSRRAPSGPPPRLPPRSRRSPPRLSARPSGGRTGPPHRSRSQVQKVERDADQRAHPGHGAGLQLEAGRSCVSGGALSSASELLRMYSSRMCSTRRSRCRFRIIRPEPRYQSA